MTFHIVPFAVRYRVIVLLSLLLLLVVAAVNIKNVNLDAFPDVTNIQVSINTEAPGLGAEEVEKLITYPIEASLYAMPNVSAVRSVSKTGLSAVTVVFDEGTDIYFARQLVFEQLQAAKALIPEGIGVPEMGPNSSGLGQVYQYILTAEDNANVNLAELRSLNDWVVKLLLMPVDGVTEVLSFGGEVKQYQVAVDPVKLLAFDLTQQDVVSALENNNLNAGGWYINRGNEQLVVRGLGWFENGAKGLAQITQVPLKTVNGKVVKLQDVARVDFGSEIRQGAVTFSSKNHQAQITRHGEVVSGIVLKRMHANTKQTIDGIKQRERAIQQALPEGVCFHVVYDQASLIEQAITTVVSALALAFVFIVVVLALFLADVRATLLVLLSIPIAICLALFAMSVFGISANLMSLGGLAIAIGLLVDGSVVMVENIYRHLQANSTLSIQQRIALAGSEVTKPIVFATLIILVVFAPLFSFEGVEAKLFIPLALSIIFAVLAALGVAIVWLPALSAWLYQKPLKTQSHTDNSKLTKGYLRLLTFVLKHSKICLTLLLVALMASVWMFSRLGSEFIPELEEGTINLRVTLAPSSSLETSLALAPKLEATLLGFDEVTYALSRIGRPELGGDPEPVNNIEIYLGLKPINTWQNARSRAELQQQMSDALAAYPGIMLNFSQPIATRVDELLSGVKAQLAIKLYGPELSVLAEKGKLIERQIKSISGIADAALEQLGGEAQLVVTPKREALSRYGMAVSDVMAVVNEGIGGVSAGQIINSNERYDINVRLVESARNNKTAIEAIRLQSPSGAWLTLSDVATVSYTQGASQIRRDNVQRRIVIEANVSGRDLGSVVADIQTVLGNIELPTGYSTEIGGQFESQARSYKRLSVIVPVSLLLIALLLYFAFGSARQAVMIMVNIPLAIIGGVFALYFSGTYLSVPSAVGFITLFGVAVLNGVVLVERINQLSGDNISLQQAVLQGASSRLRPVLMTALTSALGLVPILLSNGIGAEVQKPLAIVVLGGLVSATVLTLLVLPAMYLRFEKQRVNS
jgi:cobalt-zinc-cadmium resistance protein CzcA